MECLDNSRYTALDGCVSFEGGSAVNHHVEWFSEYEKLKGERRGDIEESQTKRVRRGS